MLSSQKMSPSAADPVHDGAKELLIRDYQYLSESFWKNEQVGETRVSLFIGFVTGVLGALGVLLTSKDVNLGAGEVQMIVIIGLASLLVLGTVTFFRILLRNSRSDGYKKGLNDIRLIFKEQDPDKLLGYSPFGETGHVSLRCEKEDQCRSKGTKQCSSNKSKPSKIRKAISGYGKGILPRKFGGLAHTVGAINSILFALLMIASMYSVDSLPQAKAPVSNTAKTEERQQDRFIIDPALRDRLIKQVSWLFVCSFLVHVLYARRRDMYSKSQLKCNSYTHAGGVVVHSGKGGPEVLLVKSSKGDDWVLPKGKIEEKEGVMEAALREVKEEGGMDCRIIRPLGTMQYCVETEEVRCRMYLMELVCETGPHEARQPNWYPFTKAREELKYPEARKMVEFARKHFSGHAFPER